MPCSKMAQITDLGQTVGFEDLEEADVVEVIESHVEELTPEDLVELRRQVEEEVSH